MNFCPPCSAGALHLVARRDFLISDFYDAHMRLILARFLRPEANFDSMEALIKAISADVEAARTQLEEEGVKQLGQEPFLLEKEGPRL